MGMCVGHVCGTCVGVWECVWGMCVGMGCVWGMGMCVGDVCGDRMCVGHMCGDVCGACMWGGVCVLMYMGMCGACVWGMCGDV